MQNEPHAKSAPSCDGAQSPSANFASPAVLHSSPSVAEMIVAVTSSLDAGGGGGVVDEGLGDVGAGAGAVVCAVGAGEPLVEPVPDAGCPGRPATASRDPVPLVGSMLGAVPPLHATRTSARMKRLRNVDRVAG